MTYCPTNPPPRQPLILFILKQCYDYSSQYGCISNGLKTSAGLVVDLLQELGERAALELAVDGNSIDKIVSENSPAKVVLEALWVTPAKLAQLIRLHPKVQWTVRIHSEVPFLATEGIAIDWIEKYLKLGVAVAFNSAQTVADLGLLGKLRYLPNYYFVRNPRKARPAPGRIDIGCFGAIRPLKNQLIQAVAAVTYAKAKRLPLYLHMNGTRLEQDGNNALKNISALMADAKENLVLHPWMEHQSFLELIATMDICLQVSMSESFNIVAADAVSMGIPLIGSEEISWLPKRSQADVSSAASIVAHMQRADASTVLMNQDALSRFVDSSAAVWDTWASE